MSILHINHLSWWAWCQSLSPLMLPSHFVLPWFLLIFANSPYTLHYFCFIMLPYCKRYTFIFIFVVFIVEVVVCNLTMVLVVCKLLDGFEFWVNWKELGFWRRRGPSESRYIFMNLFIFNSFNFLHNQEFKLLISQSFFLVAIVNWHFSFLFMCMNVTLVSIVKYNFLLTLVFYHHLLHSQLSHLLACCNH